MGNEMSENNFLIMCLNIYYKVKKNKGGCICDTIKYHWRYIEKILKN